MSIATHHVIDPSRGRDGGSNAPHRPVGIAGPAPEVVQIQTFYRGVSLGGRQLEAQPEAAFRIGAAPGVDAPVPEGTLPGGEHVLVSWAPGGFLLHTTPAMRGTATIGGRARTLEELGGAFMLEAGVAVRVDCGDVSFFVEGGARPELVPRPRTGLRWAEHRYTVMSGGGLLLFLLIAMTIPPDANALGTGMFTVNPRFLPIEIIPPEPKTELPDLIKQAKNEPGQQGKAHVGEAGVAGDPKLARNKKGRFSQAGGGEFQMTKERAIDDARNSGILGVIKNNRGGAFASIFGTESALGSDAATVMGNLVGNEIAGWGTSGMTVHGTGSEGGGTGQATIGTSTLGTLGRIGNGHNGDGYGLNLPGVRMAKREPKVPEVFIGKPETRGALDKDIIRRIIRRHVNEVKYCYEQELSRKPDLGGRIMVQFTIAATGQVIASVLQSSDMGNARVENCIVQAVRRWEFPKPNGGGLVFVSYPFVLTPAGAGGQ